MYQAPHACPVCAGELRTTRLMCPTCGTAIEGQFERSPLEKLSREQLHFVEVFLRNEGKISWVEQELGVSYPTVRAQLLDVINALGVKPAERKGDTQRAEVLRKLAAGEISAEDALQAINRA